MAKKTMAKEQVRLGLIGINGRGRLSRYWHAPDGDSIVTAAADISQYNLDQFRQYGGWHGLLACRTA